MANERPKNGTFCWNELVTTDTNKAGDFYSSLIGWEKATMPGDMPYTLFKTDGKDAGGMMARMPEMGDIPPHWMCYITVEDVDDLASKVVGLGGKVLCPPKDIPNVGRFTIIADPTGAAVGLITFPKE
ncbi:MAG TPA: VOC family protein [candidate division Zixibacteria bacterium]|nr:VOC family protein [candidate division Zixibacteria bacterium]